MLVLRFVFGIMCACITLIVPVSAEIATQPYTYWFQDSQSHEPDTILFRKFAFEGFARNIFVLTCRRVTPPLLEIIPPKALEDTLKSVAPVDPAATTISFANPDGSMTIKFSGEYDQIAAFLEPQDAEDLEKILEAINSPMSKIYFETPKLSYFMVTNENLGKMKNDIPGLFDGGRFKEVRWQDVARICHDFRQNKKSQLGSVAR